MIYNIFEMRSLRNREESGIHNFRDDRQDHNVELRSGGKSTGLNRTEIIGFEDCPFFLDRKMFLDIFLDLRFFLCLILVIFQMCRKISHICILSRARNSQPSEASPKKRFRSPNSTKCNGLFETKELFQ